ncbi:uncharacterized protein [Montipora capricornis]|uniref:uncharacterized protein n=1 Tax=Montipora capricornis TaxID=246305 RepID=UPI0035F19081
MSSKLKNVITFLKITICFLLSRPFGSFIDVLFRDVSLGVRKYSQFKVLPIHLNDLEKGLRIQVAVAVVTVKGLQDRHEGKWMVTLNDYDGLDPPTNIHVSLRANGTKFQGDLTWSLAPHSKTCNYDIHWYATVSDHSGEKRFRMFDEKQFSSPLHYVMRDLEPKENYTLKVFSVVSDKENGSIIHFVTPSLGKVSITGNNIPKFNSIIKEHLLHAICSWNRKAIR